MGVGLCRKGRFDHEDTNTKEAVSTTTEGPSQTRKAASAITEEACDSKTAQTFEPHVSTFTGRPSRHA